MNCPKTVTIALLAGCLTHAAAHGGDLGEIQVPVRDGVTIRPACGLNLSDQAKCRMKRDEAHVLHAANTERLIVDLKRTENTHRVQRVNSINGKTVEGEAARGERAVSLKPPSDPEAVLPLVIPHVNKRSNESTVPLWERFETQVVNLQNYTNPFKDVVLNATFKSHVFASKGDWRLATGQHVRTRWV